MDLSMPLDNYLQFLSLHQHISWMERYQLIYIGNDFSICTQFGSVEMFCPVRIPIHFSELFVFTFLKHVFSKIIIWNDYLSFYHLFNLHHLLFDLKSWAYLSLQVPIFYSYILAISFQKGNFLNLIPLFYPCLVFSDWFQDPPIFWASVFYTHQEYLFAPEVAS